MKIKDLNSYKNKKVAILGLGKEGKSTLRFLIGIGFTDITLLDKKEDTQRLDIENTSGVKISTVFGDNYLDTLGEFELIFKTPGISPYHEKIASYREKLTSQTEIFFNNYDAKVIGVTATKGKSTTVTILYQTLQRAGYNVKLVGNIGTPVLDEINILEQQKYDYVVYELSSFMLETCAPHCYIGILGNIYNCHLDWHANSLEVYTQAKLNLLKNAQNILIGEEFTHYLGQKNTEQKMYTFGKTGDYSYDEEFFYADKNKEMALFSVNDVCIKGEHNKKNISAVVGVCDIIKQTKHNSPWILRKLIDALHETVQSFKGLPHRIEEIGVYKDIIFIDDAIATTPESTMEAIKTFGEKIGTIFLGGYDYGFSFDEFRNFLIHSKIPNIVLFPDTGNQIFGEFSKNLAFDTEVLLEGYGDYHPRLYKTKSMKSAVEFGYKYTGKGKICILSNASPSFSLWKSYIEKGDLFKKEVLEFYKNNQS